jgi:hypothetical protein
MYNLSNHYENLYQYLHTIITDPTVIYLHPFGSTKPENLEALRNDLDPPDRRDPPEARGPIFIFYDQEPLNYTYNRELFEYIKNNSRGPWVLVNTEQDSLEKNRICEEFGFVDVNYFFHIFAAADWYRGHEYLTGIVQPIDRQLKKTYITFNRLTSNERIYRGLFVNELYKNNLLDHGYVSFSHTCPDGGSYDDNLRLGIKNQQLNPAIVEEAISNLGQLDDLRIDFQDRNYIPNQSMLLSPLPQLMESFLFVVTETCYWQPKTHLTEKIFKPIVLKMPFLLVGCAHNLEYLRSYGFKTFSDFWDESYDSIEDPMLRLQAVTNILRDISTMSPDQQKSMLHDMLPILEHNYNLFTNPKFVMKEWEHLKLKLKEAGQSFYVSAPYKINFKTGQRIPIHDPT